MTSSVSPPCPTTSRVTSLSTLNALLAPALHAYDDGHYAEAVDHATSALSGMRTRALESGGSEAWNHLIAEIRSTPLFDIAQLDPFTSHSFKKPRGYPGDALLLDWIYRDFRLLTRPQPGTQAARLYRETIDCGPAEAVRWRRQRLADLVDDAAATKPAARVLALAAGHLREADLSVALQRGLIGEVVALDRSSIRRQRDAHHDGTCDHSRCDSRPVSNCRLRSYL